MRTRKLLALLLVCAMALTAFCTAAGSEVNIVLADSGVTVDGKAASADPSGAVYVGAEIVYYQDGTDKTYGEGAEGEKHSAAEAAAHTVVTITQPGVYRISGKLSQGQIAVDLGKKAKSDPAAVVTLILDNADVTCSVAPALIFYNVYECDREFVAYDDGENPDFKASPTVDTSAAGANVILAANSVNRFTGSHVARIYKEGTTKKLHKYDAAFYSKMSMNISAEEGGKLTVVGDNEGLDSELHLTIHSGDITIRSQDDGINTNEDYVSVTTVNGGTLTIDAGNGSEGDGIDSNGYLVINGGTLWSTAHPAADGGIDADSPIQINGGTIYAFGGRNDAADNTSKQPYMELSFASRLPKGTLLELKDEGEKTVWTAELTREAQSVTLTTPELKLDTVYHLYVDGVLQCYNGNSFGMMRPGGFARPDAVTGATVQPPEAPDGQPPELPDGQPPEPPQKDGQQLPQGGRFDRGQRPDGKDFDPNRHLDFDPNNPPEGFDPSGFKGHGGMFGGAAADGSGEVDFILTASTKSFSGVCDSDASGKTRVSFTVDGVTRVGLHTALEEVTNLTSSVDLDPALVQVTVTDDPSESYFASCSLADGLGAVNALLPAEDGDYLFTVAVAAGTEGYTGASQVSFTVGALPFTDVRPSDEAYEAIRTLYKAGAMKGTGEGRFSPDAALTRAEAVTVLARMAGVEPRETGDFTDVVQNSWYSGFVGWAAEKGIVQGDGQGHFYPDMKVTAEHMRLMLTRFRESYTDSCAFSGELTRAQLAQMVAALAK